MHIIYSSLPSLKQQTVSCWLVWAWWILFTVGLVLSYGVCWKYWLPGCGWMNGQIVWKSWRCCYPQHPVAVWLVCALSQRMCRLFVERTRQNILGTYLLFTQPHTTLALAHNLTMVVEIERDTYEDNCCRDNRILCFIRSPILVSLVSVYGGYCWGPNMSCVDTVLICDIPVNMP